MYILNFHNYIITLHSLVICNLLRIQLAYALMQEQSHIEQEIMR